MVQKSIASLAEEIIQENLKTFVTEAHLPTGVTADPKAPDLRGIKVPDEYVEAILENKKTFVVEKPVVETPKQEEEVIEEEVIIEIDPQEFIDELRILINQGYLLLKEMCSTGMLGVGPGKKAKAKGKKKKYVIRKNKKSYTGA